MLFVGLFCVALGSLLSILAVGVVQRIGVAGGMKESCSFTGTS
jgi:hypothetical protein